MFAKLPSAVNRAETAAPICRLFSSAFRSHQNNQRMHGREANSVDSCDSQASVSSNDLQGRMSLNGSRFNRKDSYNKSNYLDEELETLARDLLPRVLRMPFTIEQWMSAINSVCDHHPKESSGDERSEIDRYQKRSRSYPDRPKLPMIGLSSMEKRLRDPDSKLCPKETPPASQQAITLRVPDPINLPIVWVPKLPPQTTKLLQSMPCEIFQDIHRNCQQTSDKAPPPTTYISPLRKSPSKKPFNKPGPKPKPKARTRSLRQKRPCCCCCGIARQDLRGSGSSPGLARAKRPPSKPATAPPPAKLKPKSKPAPKPKPKPKPITKLTKPAAKAAPKPGPEPEKAVEEAPPKVEVKVEEPKPAAKPSKTGSESSSEESSEPDTPPAVPAAPGPAAPPTAGRDFMADLFANPATGGSHAPSGASTPKPAAGADWLKEFGGPGAASPKPPASPGAADWLTGAAAPATGADWLTGAAPKSAGPGPDWLS